jgi:hypothetical protein
VLVPSTYRSAGRVDETALGGRVAPAGLEDAESAMMLLPWSAHEETMARRVLLGCGILSSLLYVAANLLGARRWRDYSLNSQTVSELSAIGAPSRPLVIPLLCAHGALVIPFGLGVWESAGPKRGLRVTGALLVGLGASDLPAPLFPMHRREALARGERSRTDTMHIIVTSVNSLIILLAMGFGSTAFGKPFASTQSGPSWYSSLPVV